MGNTPQHYSEPEPSSLPKLTERRVDYSVIDASQRWRMLRSQKRFFFWCE